jgi:hypothetical protein
MYLPDYSAARGTARTYDKIGSWEASQHHKDLNARLTAMGVPSGPYGGPLYDPNNSSYDFGMDGAQLMVSVDKTTLLAYIRCGS